MTRGRARSDGGESNRRRANSDTGRLQYPFFALISLPRPFASAEKRTVATVRPVFTLKKIIVVYRDVEFV